MVRRTYSSVPTKAASRITFSEPAAEFQMMRNFRIRGVKEASPASCAGYCLETRLAQLTFRAVMYLNFWKIWREKTQRFTEISEVFE